MEVPRTLAVRESKGKLLVLFEALEILVPHAEVPEVLVSGGR